MKIRWRDWPWATKLAVLLCSFAVAPLAAVSVHDLAVARGELLDAARAQNLQRARGTAQALDMYLAELADDLRLVSVASDSVRFVERPDDPELRRQAELSLRQVVESGSLAALSLTDRTGRVLLSTDARMTGRELISAPFFLRAIAGQRGVDEPRWDPEDRQVALHVFAPVLRDGRLVGTAIGRVPMAELDRILAADTDFAGRQEFGVLWDQLGLRLSQSSNPARRFRPLATLPPRVRQELVAEGRLGPGTDDLLGDPVGIEEVVERSRWLFYDRDRPATLRTSGEGLGALHAALAPLATKRWVYGVFTPEDALLAAQRRRIRRSLAIALGIGTLAALVALVAARWASRPLRLVSQAAGALATGDFGRRVGLARGDEVGRVAAAFDAMADALASKDAELRAHAGELERRVDERTAALQEARRRAEEANRIKDEFLSTVSHELRTPLNAILGWAWVLLTGNLEEGAARRALQAIERNARAQGQIIDDLLDVSRIVTGKLRLNVRRLELSKLLEAAVETVRPAAQAKGLRVDLRLDPVGPAEVAEGDPDRLQQVVWNLLSNAVKFTPEGGRVEVALGRAGHQVEIRVTDTGAGIAPEFLAYVFDRFRQADSTTTRTHGGLGLGLAIVRHLVELHGGTVEAASPGIGLGSTFIVRLPWRAAVEAGPGPDARQEPEAGLLPADTDADGDATVLAGKRVLVVDDEPDAREVLATLLAPRGAEVALAGSAAEALHLLRSSRFDLLVADVGMPVEDGYTLIRKLRTSRDGHAAMPAVALTAYAGEADRRRAFEAGFDLHLAKPVDPEALVAALATLSRRVPAG